MRKILYNYSGEAMKLSGRVIISLLILLEHRNFKSATEPHRKSTEIISVKFCDILWLILWGGGTKL